MLLMPLNRSSRGMALAAALCVSVMVLPAPAATITWLDPQAITGDSDVRLLGTLVQAANFGPGSSTTVNGVTFAPFTPSGSSFTSGQITLAGSGSQFALGSATLSSGASPYVNLSSQYRALLGPAIFSQNGTPAGPPATITVTLTGLTVGQQYEIQYWVNDPRGPSAPESASRQVQIGNQFLNVNTTGLAGGTGQWLLGNFYADNTGSQSFDVVGVSSGPTIGPVSYANAMQVRAVPEPSTLALAASGFLAAGIFLRRIRRVGRPQGE